MARISEKELARLKGEVSLVRLVERYGVELRRHGADYLGLCPFHEDHDPSLVVSPGKNLWHCLGACQAGGSVIDFVMKAEGVSFRHAVELLREDLPGGQRAQVRGVKRSTVRRIQAPVEHDADDAELLGQVIGYYHETLKQSPEALDYLERRGIGDSEAIERFKLGFSNRTLGYRLPAKNRKAGGEVRGRLERLGIFRRSGHEHFNGSLVIPVIDEQGRVLEVYGRKISSDLRSGTPLHLYLPGPHRGVWNEQALVASEEVILCEALIDALTFWSAGFRQVTSSYGVEGFGAFHLEAFKRHGTRRVLIAYDRDEAGDRAAAALATELVAEGLSCFRIQFPRGMDANEYALKVQPAQRSLELVVRRALWLGGGRGRVRGDRGLVESGQGETEEARGAGGPRGAGHGTDFVPASSEEGVSEKRAVFSLAAGEGEKEDAPPAVTPTKPSLDVEHALEEPGASVMVAADEEEEEGAPQAVAPGQPSLAVEPALEELGADVVVATGEEKEGALQAVAPGQPSLAVEPALEELGAAALVSPTPPVSSPEVPSLVSPEPPAVVLEVPAEVRGEEVRIRLGDRRWRIRGLGKNLSFEQLRVNVLVSRAWPAGRGGPQAAGPCFFVDTLDLYSARQRGLYIKQAAEELELEERVIKRDLGKVVLKLEELQDRTITEALSPRAKGPMMSEGARGRAMALLEDPDLLSRILSDFERCQVVGEQTNKLVCYLAAVSRKLEEPLAVVIQSSTAAGKTSLMEAVLSFFPAEEQVKYSAMTGQSLFYMGEQDLSHKVLAIVEEEGAQRASYALKLLQSERELTIASTGKDVTTGRLVTQEYRVEGPVTIFLTTTAVQVDEELLNRCIVLSVDEEREQTRAIHRSQRQQQTLEGQLFRRDREEVLAVHRDAQRLLRPLLVANPYAERLTFLDSRTRARRDHMKYLTLIRAIALLHQYQRPVKTAVHKGERVSYIEVTLKDIEVANRLSHQVLGRCLDELSPQVRRLLMLIKQMVDEGCERQGLERSDYRFTRREVREHAGWGPTQVAVHLERLVELEYLLVHRGGRGQQFVYELLHDGGPGEGVRHLDGLVDVEALRAMSTAGDLPDQEGDLPGSYRGQTGAKPAGFRGGETGQSPSHLQGLEPVGRGVAGNAHLEAASRSRSCAQKRGRGPGTGPGPGQMLLLGDAS